MPTMLDSIRLCCCCETDRIDRVSNFAAASAKAATMASTAESEHFLVLRPEADCLQRWLDLNA